MLHIHYSNYTEVLFDALCAVLATPLRNVFQPEVIVVEERGMARWLAQQLAARTGIAANIEFPMPAKFVWQLLHSQLEIDSSGDEFNKETLLWHAMALLPALEEASGFEGVRRYLSGANDEVKTYQLSREIADLFDQYLVYRPREVLAWEAGEESHWQAMLWRAMAGHWKSDHWAHLLEAFVGRVGQGPLTARRIPERVSLFALSALSPGYTELLARVADHLDVHLFVLNPSLNYWGDIVPERDIARLRERWRRSGRPDVSEHYAVGNALLASMGKPCRDFVDQWQDHVQAEDEAFLEPARATLLGRVQSDILNLQDRGRADIPNAEIPLDDSIQVHSCHSPMREVQILYDRLLGLFEARRDLRPHEVVVVAPDIHRYTPYVQAVFGAAPASRRVPFQVSEPPASEDPIAEALLSWLRLPDERFEAPAVLGWLEIPAVAARLGLDEAGIETIRRWVGESGIRWGLDGRHKAAFGLPDTDQNTWAFGFRRLFLGYALPPGAELYAGVAPYPHVEGGDAVWLGQLQEFIDRLGQWREVMARPTTLGDWQQRMNRLIDAFFAPNEEETLLLNQVREGLARTVERAHLAGFGKPVGAPVLHEHLASVLAGVERPALLFTGKVTFANLSAVRGLPFRVVCMLGMNDGEFPRTQRPLEFDLIARQPRKGDRSLRDADRYAFLQSLLCTRDHLHISYVGHSQQDNQARLPTVVVTELLDYIEQAYRLGDGSLRAAVQIAHPLQPFSHRNYLWGSYAGEWLERDPVQPGFVDEALPPPDDVQKVIDLGALVRFARNPSRHFLESRLGLRSAEYEEALSDSETYDLDALEAYQVRSETVEELLDGKTIERSFALLQARGALPQGGCARLAFDDATTGLTAFVERVAERLRRDITPVEVALAFGDVRVVDRMRARAPDGLVRYRPARLKGKDQVQLWIEHLGLCAAGHGGTSVHLALDNDVALGPLAREDAIAHLSRWVDLYQEGLRLAVPLFPETTVEYARSIAKGKPPEDALVAARRKWEGGYQVPGEREDPWFEQAFRDTDPLTDRFGLIATELLVPMFEHRA